MRYKVNTNNNTIKQKFHKSPIIYLIIVYQTDN